MSTFDGTECYYERHNLEEVRLSLFALSHVLNLPIALGYRHKSGSHLSHTTHGESQAVSRYLQS